MVKASMICLSQLVECHMGHQLVRKCADTSALCLGSAWFESYGLLSILNEVPVIFLSPYCEIPGQYLKLKQSCCLCLSSLFTTI
jgi:hypothetical protein